MSAYLFNSKDKETNKLMGVVIFLVLSLVFTIVIAVSVFLIYFEDYNSIQKQYLLLEEKLQKISIENYEKNTDYTRLNVELNQFKNEVNKLNLEKEVSDKNIKLVDNFIESVSSGNIEEVDKFLSPDSELLNNEEIDFPDGMSVGNFVLNDDLETGRVTYFSTEEDARTDKYVFNMVLKGEDWLISDIEVFEYRGQPEMLLN